MTSALVTMALVASMIVAPAAAAITASVMEETVPAAAPSACAVEDASLTWGFKESFRSYISGTIANGEWEVSDGTTYETPNFGWTTGSGTYGFPSELSFEGAIRFTGHDGILDTTVANPRLEWSGDRGTLFLDVAGVTQEGDPIDAKSVPFATLELPDPDYGGVELLLVDVAVTLTDEGASAFGTYESGEGFDPLSIDITLEEGCRQPDRPSMTWLPWLIGGLLAIAVIGVTVFAIRRTRRPRTAD